MGDSRGSHGCAQENCGMTTGRRFGYSLFMTRAFRTLLAALALASMGWALPAEPPTPTTTAPILRAEELSAAVRLDALTIPTPGELLAAIDKLGKPDWASAIRPPISTTYSSRAQMALNIGGLIADGFIAVEAKDA